MDNIRKQFEAWAKKYLAVVNTSSFKLNSKGEYDSDTVEILWIGYQQGRKDALEEAAKVCDGLERTKWETIHKVVTQGGKLQVVGARDCAEAIRALDD